MGEYAEMMLDGTCCEGCGAFLGGASGYPRYCSSECAAYRGAAEMYAIQMGEDPKPHRCSKCDKGFTTEHGLRQHAADVHEKRRKAPCPSCGKAVSLVGMDSHQGSPNCLARSDRLKGRRRIADDGFDVIEE